MMKTSRLMSVLTLAAVMFFCMNQSVYAGSWQTSYQCLGTFQDPYGPGSWSNVPAIYNLGDGSVYFGDYVPIRRLASPSISDTGTITATLTWIPNNGDAPTGTTLTVLEKAYAETYYEYPTYSRADKPLVGKVDNGFQDTPIAINSKLLDEDGVTCYGEHLTACPIIFCNGVYTVTVPTRTFLATGSVSDTTEPTSGPWNGFPNHHYIDADIDYSVGLPPPFSGIYINKDLPTNTSYQGLPTPAVLYGGSIRFTSDELLLLADPNTIPGTTYTWSVSGPGTYPQPPSGPIWNVIIPPTPGIVTFQCMMQRPGASPTITSLSVEVGIRTDDTILVGWIDRNAVPISPSGVDAAVLADLPANGGVSPNIAGTARIAALVDNDDCLDYLTCTTPYNATDKNYILDWMFHFADNPDPTPTLQGLTTPDVTNPTGLNATNDLTTTAGYMSYPKLADYMSDLHRFKLLNHFQVKYRVNLTNLTQFNGAPMVLQGGATIGATVNPTGLPPDLSSVLNELASLPFPYSIPGLAAASLNHSLNDPQAGPANGVIGPTPSVDHISQCNDGSPEIPAIRAFNTLMGLDVPNPLFWQNIGSKITFTCPNTAPNPPTYENYPTYYWYGNGLFVRPFPQAGTPQGHFFANPYPFGTDPSYGLPPEGPGNIPLIPGVPSFPTIDGGRNGIASTPGDASSSIPAYIVP